MGKASRIGGKLALWALLGVPALAILPRAIAPDAYLPDDAIAPTGLWSARLIVAALMLTPLSILFRGQAWIRWLVRHRRALGVAAFAYALLHLYFYLLDMGALGAILAEIGALGIWTGWAAFGLMLPLALTSNDASMRRLKAGWKRLQRLAYPAALLTLVHWMFIHDSRTEAVLHFAPLALLQLYRLARGRTYRSPKPQLETSP